MKDHLMRRMCAYVSAVMDGALITFLAILLRTGLAQNIVCQGRRYVYYVEMQVYR